MIEMTLMSRWVCFPSFGFFVFRGSFFLVYIVNEGMGQDKDDA